MQDEGCKPIWLKTAQLLHTFQNPPREPLEALTSLRSALPHSARQAPDTSPPLAPPMAGLKTGLGAGFRTGLMAGLL